MVSRGENANFEYLSFTLYVHMLDNLSCFSIFPIHRFTVASSNVADRLIYGFSIDICLAFKTNKVKAKKETTPLTRNCHHANAINYCSAILDHSGLQ